MAHIIAHRGASVKAPQNTLASFKLASTMKCDGFETDVHLTKDKNVVICHNYDIDETSDGSGFIRDMTLKELRSYDFGSYFDGSFKGEKIPTLHEFLEVVREFSVINIEVKPPLDGNLAVVEKTLEEARGLGLLDKLLISSFSDEVLLESKRLLSSVSTGLLYDPNSAIIEKIFDDPFTFAKSLGCDALHPVYFYVDEDYIERAHKEGFAVNAWTCNREAVISALIAAGCDGIITDVPDTALAVQKSLKEKC